MISSDENHEKKPSKKFDLLFKREGHNRSLRESVIDRAKELSAVAVVRKNMLVGVSAAVESRPRVRLALSAGLRGRTVGCVERALATWLFLAPGIGCSCTLIAAVVIILDSAITRLVVVRFALTSTVVGT